MKLAFSKAPEPWMEMSQSSPDSAHLYFSTGTRAPITHWTYRASTSKNQSESSLLGGPEISHEVQQTTSLLRSILARQGTCMHLSTGTCAHAADLQASRKCADPD
jgi:hypothetical protein